MNSEPITVFGSGTLSAASIFFFGKTVYIKAALWEHCSLWTVSHIPAL